ncbi:hypothetical protein SD70_25330 [Gordoniibacillus kamchatkensis]|uniref:Glycosyl hydrolase family 31 C-terminal domain-containing protein n=2 Tax=Gordoniibacillus kamchatkensis TaxID=1590651 RepID=A0ABR5ACC4_9BACL|nr:hypothetical protein SD70_25330 [Paenibacillus sp. VKM B-2647]
MPMMRAMMLHYNDDPNVHNLPCVSVQYMFGRDMLVAPIFYEGSDREVYLPAGGWVHLWTGQRTEGPWNGRVRAPLLQTPVWLRSGAVIPLLPEGAQTIGRYDDPSRWLEALGTERWEFMLAPGEGACNQGGVDITQSDGGQGGDGAYTVRVSFSRERGVVPGNIALKIRLPEEDEASCTVAAVSGWPEAGTAGLSWEWNHSAWESGLWIELRLPETSAGAGAANALADADIVLHIHKNGHGR